MSSCSDNTCGMGGPGGPLPGDPDSSNVVLSATPAFGGIDVSWTYPAINPAAVAHVKLYRSASADFGGAILLNIVNGTFYYDRVDANIQYWYWIQIVSVTGTVGELIGPASAHARPLIQDLIEQLTAKIDSGMLAIALKGKLDEISLLNADLLNEITAREDANTTLAEAIAAAEAGSAQALTFIASEQASRATADSAIAESIDIVAATLGGDFAAVTTAMQVDINATKGTVDAMYTAKVNVNGLIGGFGIHNDGASVDAGFDTDTFWVGRTAANKRKPFIIVGSETFIDEAVINHLTFSKLRDESGSFIVEGGRVKADYLRVGTASMDDLAVTRAKMGNAAVGSAQIDDLAVGTAHMQDLSVNTLKIGNQAVTIPVGTTGDGSSATVGMTCPEAMTVFFSGTVFLSATGYARLRVDNNIVWTGAGVAGSTVTGGFKVDVGAGFHTFGITADLTISSIPASVFAMGIRR